MTNRVLIIGGGISGLSAAYYLNKAGFRAALIDKSPRLGGVIRTDRLEGCLVERGPDSFLAAKPWASELIREVGLDAEVIHSNDRLRVTYVVRNGKLVPLPDGMIMMVPTKILPLITTSLLSWPCKIRMGLEFLRRPKPECGDRSVADFLRDHYGQEAIDYLAEPLLAGVFGGDPENLSVNSVLGRFVEIEEKYGSLSRGVVAAPKPGTGSAGSLFRTLKGGLGQLVDKLIPAADVIRGEAQALERTPAGWRARVAGSWMEAEAVFLGLPAYAAGNLLSAVDGTLAELLNGIPYNSSITVSLVYDRNAIGHPIQGFGFLVPKVERARLKACTWVNNKFDHRAAEGKILLRCFFGGGDLLGESDEAIAGLAEEELRSIMGLQAKAVAHMVTRWPDAMPQYVVGHGERLARIKTLSDSLPGLRLGGNGFNGIGVPDCIHSGKLAAEHIAQRLAAGA